MSADPNRPGETRSDAGRASLHPPLLGLVSIRHIGILAKQPPTDARTSVNHQAARRLTQATARLVARYLARHQVEASDLPDLIIAVNEALRGSIEGQTSPP
jgi:hypothetical protein